MERTREQRHTQPVNWAEWLLDLGKQAHQQIRGGAGIEEVSRNCQNSLNTCKLSLVFYHASDVIKVRALVEDWSRERLVLELGGGTYRSCSEKKKADLTFGKQP